MKEATRILTECGIEKTVALAFWQAILCVIYKTKGLDACCPMGVTVQMMVRYIFIECGGFGHYGCELNFEEVQYYIDITPNSLGFIHCSETRQRYNKDSLDIFTVIRNGR